MRNLRSAFRVIQFHVPRTSRCTFRVIRVFRFDSACLCLAVFLLDVAREQFLEFMCPFRVHRTRAQDSVLAGRRSSSPPTAAVAHRRTSAPPTCTGHCGCRPPNISAADYRRPRPPTAQPQSRRPPTAAYCCRWSPAAEHQRHRPLMRCQPPAAGRQTQAPLAAGRTTTVEHDRPCQPPPVGQPAASRHGFCRAFRCRLTRQVAGPGQLLGSSCRPPPRRERHQLGGPFKYFLYFFVCVCLRGVCGDVQAMI